MADYYAVHSGCYGYFVLYWWSGFDLRYQAEESQELVLAAIFVLLLEPADDYCVIRGFVDCVQKAAAMAKN